MKQSSNLIHNRKIENFNIKGDKQLFLKIVEDMKNNSNKLSPISHWHLINAGGNKKHTNNIKTNTFDKSLYKDIDENLFNNKYSTLKEMLDPWVGFIGMQNIDETVLNEYQHYINKFDYLNLLPAIKEKKENHWIVSDLGSIMDINLIDIFLNKKKSEINILEIGGGFGRLAETVLNVYKNQVHYILVDAVPASLMYSYLYLKKTFPKLKIGFYYNNDKFIPQKYDCYIMPSWHFEKLNKYTYDLSINIESMQEMNQFHVDYYLNLFNKITNKDGIIYISNAHDYVFKGNWNYPNNWKRLFIQNTPRSWTLNHPTEIFKKGKKDFSKQNYLQTRIYQRFLESHLKLTELGQINY